MRPANPDARNAARLAEARRYFRGHHAGVTPDIGFVTRVSARLRRDPAEDMGRMALRLLPASLALALVLAWIALGHHKAERQAPATDVDLVQWVYSEAVAAQ